MAYQYCIGHCTWTLSAIGHVFKLMSTSWLSDMEAGRSSTSLSQGSRSKHRPSDCGRSELWIKVSCRRMERFWQHNSKILFAQPEFKRAEIFGLPNLTASNRLPSGDTGSMVIDVYRCEPSQGVTHCIFATAIGFFCIAHGWGSGIWSPRSLRHMHRCHQSFPRCWMHWSQQSPSWLANGKIEQVTTCEMDAVLKPGDPWAKWNRITFWDLAECQGHHHCASGVLRGVALEKVSDKAEPFGALALHTLIWCARVFPRFCYVQKDEVAHL